jgi:hypothetical protein
MLVAGEANMLLPFKRFQLSDRFGHRAKARCY